MRQVLTVYHNDMYSQGLDEPLGQINIGLQQGTVIEGQWYRLQDKQDQHVVGADGRHSLIQLNMSYSEAAKEPSDQRMPSPVPIIAKATPAAVTRRAAPPVPPPRLSDSHSQNESPVNIEVTLNMEYNSIISTQEAFKYEICNDLARAVRGFPDKVHVVSIRPGSVIVDAQLSHGLCPGGQSLANVLDNLEHQVNDPSSLLKKGKYTKHVLRIRKVPADDNDMSPRIGSDVDDSIMDIPLQIDTDSPSYSPVQVEKRSPAQVTRAAPPPVEPQPQGPKPPPRPSMQQKLDHYHPAHMKPLNTRESFVEMPRYHSSTAPTSPPLLHDPKQAYPNPFMYPMNRGLDSQPQQQRTMITQPQQQSYMQNPSTQMAQRVPTQQQQTPAWLPMPSTWYGRYKQRRIEQKQMKQAQREEAMERLREQERSRGVSQSKAGRSGVVAQLWTMLSPAKYSADFPGAVHPAPNYRPMSPPYVPPAHGPGVPQQPAFASPPVPMPVPRLKEKPQHHHTSHQHQHDVHASRATPQQRQHHPVSSFGAPKEYGTPMAMETNRQLFGENPTEHTAHTETIAAQERVATWIGATAPQMMPTENGPRDALPIMMGPPKTLENHYMPRPMEPNLADVFAGTGTVRFHPGVPDHFSRGNPSGKRFDSFSGHNTPVREYAFSPVALSAMTAPTPRVESSMWSSIEMAIGDIPQEVSAFPHGYDPSKPFAPAGPPPGAFSLRPQEVTGRSVANPQASIGTYMQNRGGDVVIQPSRHPAAIRLGDSTPNFQGLIS